MACIEIPALPLQLLLRREPDWSSHPTAVVDCDKPQGRVLWVNDRARRARVLPGMRYAAALSLAGDLRAAEVPPAAVERAAASIIRRLRKFTPDIEPSREVPGVYWLGASGLGRIYPSLSRWAHSIRDALKRHEKLEATVVVGSGKFATCALARASRGVRVFEERSAERAALRRVPLDRLMLDPRTLECFEKLGVRTAGDFIDLPAEGIARRFGKEVWELYRRAREERRTPLVSLPPAEPIRTKVHLDHAECDAFRLMSLAVDSIQPLKKALSARGEAIAGIRLALRLDRGGIHLERIRPAAPTIDLLQLSELLRLRLDAARLSDGVTDIALTLETARIAWKEGELFAERPRRDPRAASRALARIRAEFGDRAVVRARLGEGHLPEALFSWEPLDEIPAPEPLPGRGGMLVRRIYSRPARLPSRPRHEPDGWMPGRLDEGPVVRLLGPYVISGGWWRKPAHREYHFAETQRGEILWLYYDRLRRRWRIQGRVE